jgi:hypothetical protein
LAYDQRIAIQIARLTCTQKSAADEEKWPATGDMKLLAIFKLGTHLVFLAPVAWG